MTGPEHNNSCALSLPFPMDPSFTLTNGWDTENMVFLDP